MLPFHQLPSGDREIQHDIQHGNNLRMRAKKKENHEQVQK